MAKITQVLNNDTGLDARNKINNALASVDTAEITDAAVTYSKIQDVSATDKETGKEQKIVIKASSGLSDEEIEKMISEAEANADSDKDFRDLVDIKNQADQVIHATEKSLEELGEKVTNEERSTVESALNDLKDSLKSDDKDKIESKLKTLSEASVGIAQKAFEEAQANAQNESTENENNSEDENVVDAEYEEVDSEENKNTH